MSSVSLSSSFAKPDFSVIRKQIDKTIDSDVASGKISSDDAKAIKSAEDNISKLFDASASTSGASASLDPSEVKSKIDTLIDGQVKSGKLTSAQADELKSVLQKGPKPGGPHGVGHSGSGGADSANALDALFDDDDSDASSTATDPNTLLEDFLKQLQTGSSKDRSTTPKLVDYLA